jgi:hypothetical protein
MYAVLSKKNQTSWDVVYIMPEHPEERIKGLMEDALANDSHLVGMETTSFRDDVRLQSAWDGTSFSGGVQRPEGSEVLDIWDNNKRFSFLSNNTVVANIVISNESVLSDLLSEKFQNEVILVKIPVGQAVSAGETYGWNGSEFTEV